MAAYRKLVSDSGKLTECLRCGYNNKQVLEVHHKDRNRSNNSMENLEVLCANCHKLEHDIDRRRKRGRTKPPTNQVNVRYPQELLDSIDKTAGFGKRSEWIFEACRMRLDGAVENCASVQGTHQSKAGETEQAAGRIQPTVTQPNPSLEERKSIALAAMAQAEKTFGEKIFAGAIDLAMSSPPEIDFRPDRTEIPICSFKWWEDGEQYECLMDAGHSIPLKHGRNGMVRRINE